jgi:two-component system, NtrC family, sensor kinase
METTSTNPTRRPLPRRLIFRLALALALGAGAILVAAGTWNLRLQRRHLTRLVEAQAAELVQVIRASTRDAMLRNDSGELRRMIGTLAAQEGIDRLRVFDKQGRITLSSEPSEAGGLVDLKAEQCVACHAAGQPLTRLGPGERARTFTRSGGGRVLGLIEPIRNEAACANAACHAHPPERTVLGVLDVQLSLSAVDASLAASQSQLLTGLVGTALGVLLLTGALTWRMVLRPVGRLTAAAPRLAAGDFSARVPEDADDEIGDLSRAWNRMAEELGTAHHNLSEWSLRLEERVCEKTAELEQTHQNILRVEKMASLGKLAAIVAHELNNPLAGIATYARLLRRRLAQPPPTPPDEAVPSAAGEADGERILKLMEDEALRCGGIVKNLLLFSRTPGARFAPENAAVLADRCALLVRHPFELRNVELAVDVPAGLPPLDCDAAQIQQMLLALVMNALEATPAEGKVTISARAGELDGRLRLRVADTGHGIPPEIVDKIFEPFFTTKEQGNGVGLGLAVAYGIVERHRGTIGVDSTPERGTVFTIDLPLRQPAADDGSNEPPAGGPAAEGSTR